MKKLIAVSVVSAFCLALVTSVAIANYGSDNSLSGRVREKGTLTSIHKAKVTLYAQSGRKKDSDKTDKNGKYSFSDLNEKKYVIKVQAAGYRSPKDATKDKVSYKVKVDGSSTKNVYLIKK